MINDFNEFITLYPITAYIFFGILCLAVGSLLNVIIYRLPLMLQAEWSSQCHLLLSLPEKPREKLNLFYPRSFCTNCRKMIPFWHNIPIISYAILRGRCRQCHQSISVIYPLIETTTLLLSLLAAYTFGFHFSLIFILLFIWTIICLAAIDLQHQILPDCLTLSLIWLGLIANTQTIFTTLPDAVLSAAGAYVSLWLFIKLFYLVTGKIGMGEGDFKLFSAFGAWFGWAQLPLILLISTLTGAIIGIIYLKLSKQTKETPIPFGPFLCVSGVISLFYGTEIIQSYLKLFV